MSDRPTLRPPDELDVLSSQELFREVNERARDATDGLAPGRLDVFCECVGGCLGRLVIPRDEYESVRRFPTRFVMQDDHVAASVERVVDRHDGYVVVEKIGPAAGTAIRLDPRRGPALNGDGHR